MQSINSFPFKDFGKTPALRWPQGRNPELSTLEQNAWERVPFAGLCIRKHGPMSGQVTDTVGTTVTVLTNGTFTPAELGVHTFTGLTLSGGGLHPITVFDVARKAILGTLTIDMI